VNRRGGEKKITDKVKKIKVFYIFAVLLINARMAELVDALVSNTSGSNAVPVRSRLRVQTLSSERVFLFKLPGLFLTAGVRYFIPFLCKKEYQGPDLVLLKVSI
jgi:hypothetical protein